MDGGWGVEGGMECREPVLEVVEHGNELFISWLIRVGEQAVDDAMDDWAKLAKGWRNGMASLEVADGL